MNSAKQKTFGTDRLFLMPLSKADLADMHILNSDERVMKFIREPDRDLNQTQIAVDRMLAHGQAHPGLGFWKILTKEEHHFMGFVGIFPLDQTSDFELGYRIHKDFWGYNYAVEAAKTLLEHVKSLNLITICYAIIHPENIQSRRVLEKLGFTYVDKAVYYNNNVDKFKFDF